MYLHNDVKHAQKNRLMYAKSATTISNILEAAQALFLEKNYADVTMTDIAGAAEVTKGALYHHFSGKEDLYLRMMHSYLEEMGSILREVAEASKGTCRQRLHQFTLTFLQLPPQKRELMGLVRRDINIFKDPQREQLIRAYQAALPEQVESIIYEGIINGEIMAADARLLSWEHVAMVELALRPYAQRVLGSHQETADFVIRVFFDGVASKRD